MSVTLEVLEVDVNVHNAQQWYISQIYLGTRLVRSLYSLGILM